MSYRQQKMIYESQVEKQNLEQSMQEDIIASLQEIEHWSKSN